VSKFIIRPKPVLNESSPIDASYLVLAVLLVVLGVVMITNAGFRVDSDGSNYFAYLRSAVFDRDLDFHNEFAHFNKAFWTTYQPKETVTGHLTNVFSVGPAVLWAPFYLAAHLFVLAANFCGAGIKPDGFSSPYLLSINLASLFYAFAGMCLVYKISRGYFGPRPALAATVTVWLATFITYYTVYQPYMSHALSFFTVTLFIYYWHATRPARTPRQWALLGLMAGLMMLVRWQNGLIMIFPAIESLMLFSHTIRLKDRQAAFSILKNSILFLVFTVVGFLPQMAAWKVIYGGFLTIPQGTGFLRWSEPFISEILFSSRHGLYSWSPVVYIATIGWLLFFKRDKLFFFSGLAAFLLMTYVNSVISDWWAGWGFGMRRFDGFILLFALGLAAVFYKLRKSWPKGAAVVMISTVLFFSGYNCFLIGRLNSGAVHRGGPVDWSRVLQVSKNGIYGYTGYPFSFPANIIFSMRFKLSPARYDTLVGGFIDDPYFYGNTIRFAGEPTLLGRGWSAPATFEKAAGRTMKKEALVYAPVRTITNFEMVVRCISEHPPAAGISIYANGREIGKIYPSVRWNECRLKLPRQYIHAGINTLEFINPGESNFTVDYLKFSRLEIVPDWKTKGR